MGSGNIVHNLSMVNFSEGAKPFDWALEFDEKARGLIETGNHTSLIEYHTLGESAKLAIPTPDHYYPFLYTLGLQDSEDQASFPVTGLPHSSISMRSVKFGWKVFILHSWDPKHLLYFSYAWKWHRKTNILSIS